MITLFKNRGWEAIIADVSFCGSGGSPSPLFILSSLCPFFLPPGFVSILRLKCFVLLCVFGTLISLSHLTPFFYYRVDNAIFLVALVVGLIMGALGVALERSTDFLVDAGGNATLVGFVMGFIVGFAVCILLLATISSGVNTVIVMYADAPAEFERNHPELSRKMREAWTLVYPGSV